MTRDELIKELYSEGLVVVPFEPTVAMVEAGYAGAFRVVPRYVRELIDNWLPHAGARHPHEPGLVTALREAVKAGAVGGRDG